jgi:pimeloyl-ACP methyl ester carboxylesterase
MPQLVFIHGPGAGGCSDCYHYQIQHFPGSLAPNLPGHIEGQSCADVKSYTEWVRGWLWAQEKKRDLVLVGYTLGACIALQYALDYPEEVLGAFVTTAYMKPKKRPQAEYEMRRRAAAGESEAYKEWLAHQDRSMMFVEPSFKAKLMERHMQIGPLSQLHDFESIDSFDVSSRISTFKPKLLLLRGTADPSNRPEYEKEIHEAVPGSRYIELAGAGHFPASEKPDEINRLIEEFLTTF